MKIVRKEEEFETLFSTAKSEAQKYFGNDEIYIEKFFQTPDILKFRYYLGKIELSTFMKEIALCREGIKN